MFQLVTLLIYIIVFTSNIKQLPPKALYEKAGFKDTGRIIGQKALVLELKL
ncbi:MAG: hypothetical protein ACFFC7_08420 [Candidatus Hermodarchaeota archaeon]